MGQREDVEAKGGKERRVKRESKQGSRKGNRKRERKEGRRVRKERAKDEAIKRLFKHKPDALCLGLIPLIDGLGLTSLRDVKMTLIFFFKF